mmetsp:Transcript_3661/g.10516  ORF Transcript_3661/g.10516 Transcript_3661/m.10516 type:complete len:310 (-) Transcript_3661:167-1096(-)
MRLRFEHRTPFRRHRRGHPRQPRRLPVRVGRITPSDANRLGKRLPQPSSRLPLRIRPSILSPRRATIVPMQQHEVLRLDVPVHNALGMTLRQKPKHTAHDRSHLPLAIVPLQPIKHTPTLAQLHHQVHRRIVLKHVLQIHCIQRTPDLPHRIHLGLQLEQVPRRALVILWHLRNRLDRVLLPRRTLRAVTNHPKATGSKHLRHQVPIAQVPGEAKHIPDLVRLQFALEGPPQDLAVRSLGLVVGVKTNHAHDTRPTVTTGPIRPISRPPRVGDGERRPLPSRSQNSNTPARYAPPRPQPQLRPCTRGIH